MTVSQLEFVFAEEHVITIKRYRLMNWCWDCSACWFNSGYDSEEQAVKSSEGHLAKYGAVS